MSQQPAQKRSPFLIEQEIASKEEQLLEEYYFQVRETEKYYGRDVYGALKIQSLFKMYTCLKRFAKLKAGVIRIQNWFRVFLSRMRFARLKAARVNALNIAYFSTQAVTIQRSFRAYYQRKFTHDFYARKQFLRELGEQNEKFHKEMLSVEEEERIDEQKRAEASARNEFSSLAQNLHHLSSTHQIPGVYNPPYSLVKPTAFNVEVETHLKATFKANYTWKAPTRKDIANFTIKPFKRSINQPHQSTIKISQN